jgi:hypothetical protein
MYLSFVNGNILQKFSKDRYNIVYYPQNNLFDYSLMLNDDYNYFIFGNNQKDYHMPNIIDLPQSYISLYNYNLSMTNNIVGHTTNNLKQFHLNTIIFTHSYKPHYIKKEDALLINKRLTRETKVFFSEKSKESWGLSDNSHIVKYGIPQVFRNQTKQKDRKDVLVLNYENMPHNQQLCQAIKSEGYSCDIISSCTDTSLEDINNTFNQYKTCIDLADHNILNLMCSIAAGCSAISIKTPMLQNEYSSVGGLLLVDSIASVVSQIKNVVDLSNDESREQYALQALKTFDYDTFKNSMKTLITRANSETFVL